MFTEAMGIDDAILKSGKKKFSIKIEHLFVQCTQLNMMSMISENYSTAGRKTGYVWNGLIAELAHSPVVAVA
jgi:hypothetical protein